MMNRIAALDDDTVRKIAAGEVIERPSSVVKELIENSIDASSSRISVDVSRGGGSLIKVTDNGTGMAREDAELCFKRHTTSKIRRIEDLDDLKSLGFRGEALASICAISRVEILTKPRGAVVGTRLIVEAGKLGDVMDAGCPEGTAIAVKNLFYNLPARRKHLKSERRELALIADVVSRYSLFRNDISFSLSHNGRKMIESPPTRGHIDSATNIFGSSMSRSLIPLEYDSADLKVRGFAGKPHSTRSSTEMQFFYVNGRYVTSRLIGGAVKEAYGTLLPKGRYPVCMLSLAIDPERIDINIHPAKLQVKFTKESEVYRTVVSAMKEALKKESLVPETSPGIFGTQKRIPKPLTAKAARSSRIVSSALGPPEQGTITVPKMNKLPELNIIGDFGETYILAESSKGMVVLDQHAAHERILYEKLLNEKTNTQELISPIALELSAKETSILEDFSDALANLGFNLESFGKNTQRVDSVPVVLGALISPELIHDAIADMATLPKTPEEGAEERIARIIAKKSASVACRRAIKGGEKQSMERLERLVRDLYKSSNPYTCPHGRPTMIFITKEELEKRFLRT
jgi:DNA mismatch repair protein MutL